LILIEKAFVNSPKTTGSQVRVRSAEIDLSAWSPTVSARGGLFLYRRPAGLAFVVMFDIYRTMDGGI
jgi:hypothetical protein